MQELHYIQLHSTLFLFSRRKCKEKKKKKDDAKKDGAQRIDQCNIVISEKDTFLC